MSELNRHEPSGSRELANGCCLFWHPNQVGGRTYISDEVGGGVFVWDTALVSETTLKTALEVEAFMQGREVLPATEDVVALRLSDKVQVLQTTNISLSQATHEINRLKAFIDSIRQAALAEKTQAMLDGFRAGVALGNNICVDESDRANGDDRITEASATGECANRIRQWLDSDPEAVQEIVHEFKEGLPAQEI